MSILSAKGTGFGKQPPARGGPAADVLSGGVGADRVAGVIGGQGAPGGAGDGLADRPDRPIDEDEVDRPSVVAAEVVGAAANHVTGRAAVDEHLALHGVAPADPVAGAAGAERGEQARSGRGAAREGPREGHGALPREP